MSDTFYIDFHHIEEEGCWTVEVSDVNDNRLPATLADCLELSRIFASAADTLQRLEKVQVRDDG